MHQLSCIRSTHCFVVPPSDLLCDATYKIPLDATANMPNLKVILTYIYLITKMDSLLTNHVMLASQVVEAINTDLDKCKIHQPHCIVPASNVTFIKICINCLNHL